MISSSSFMRRYQGNSEFYRQKQSFRQSKLRYLALFLACMIMLGDAYCFDNPMALQSKIQGEFLITNLEFNLLYTVYSLPNIVLPFFGGILIDKLGARIAIMLFSTVIFLGQAVCVAGAYYTSYWMLITGRVVFGIGSESLNISQNTIMAQWFRDQEMSLAIGLCISIPKLGSAANSLLSPYVVKLGGTTADAFLLGMGFLAFSYLCACALVIMDKESDKRENQSQRILENFLKQNQDLLANNKGGSKSLMKKIEVQSFEKSKIHDSSDEIDKSKSYRDSKEEERIHLATNNRKGSKDLSSFHEPKVKSVEPSPHHEHKEEINLRDLAKLSGTFWIVISICMISEALFVPFLDNGNDFFQSRFGFTPNQAGMFLITPYVVSSILTPIFGIFSDKIGHRGLLILLTTLVFLGTHILLLFLQCDSACVVSAIPLFLLGTCFAFYASVIIPSVPLVVKPQLIGTAFGLTGVFQNSALALFPLLTGLIYDHFSMVNGKEDKNMGYIYQSYFFVGMSIFNVSVAVFLLIIDKRGARQLYIQSQKKTSMLLDENRGPRTIDSRHLVPEQRDLQ